MKKLIYILLLFPWMAEAAPGDRLYVTAESAYILEGPGADHVLVVKLQKNQALTELGTEGEWVNVAVPEAEGQEGWILASQISTTRILEIPIDANDPKFEQFKLDVLALNDLVKASVVRGLYGKIENRSDGTVFVGISNTWLNFTQEERTANLKYLMYLWESQHPPGTPLTVQLVDARGQKIMKTSLYRR